MVLLVMMTIGEAVLHLCQCAPWNQAKASASHNFNMQEKKKKQALLWRSPRVPGIATAVGLPLLTASPFLLVMLRVCRAASTLPPLGQDWAQITLLLSQMQTSAFICSLTLLPGSKITAKSNLWCAERLGNSLMVTSDTGHPDLEMLLCLCFLRCLQRQKEMWKSWTSVSKSKHPWNLIDSLNIDLLTGNPCSLHMV